MNNERSIIRVLLVEDNPTDVLLLREELAETRDPRFEIIHVHRLEEALARLNEIPLDVVLLDLGLPDSHGLETFTRLQRRNPHLPILVLSGLDDEQVAIESVHAGAQDYLVKGSVGCELLVRAIRYAIQRKRVEEELRRRNEQLQDDLNMASEFQRAFLPHKYPCFPAGVNPAESALRFAHRYQPSGAVGGDYFDILRLADDRAGIFLCDVMGHGVRAALVTAMIRGLVEELKPLAHTPAAFITQLNSSLAEVLKQTDTTMFATAVYLMLDLRLGQLVFSNAGHPAPLLIRAADRGVAMLDGNQSRPGPVLGLFDHSSYPELKQTVGVGDQLLLYTDGVYEVDDAAGDQFGQDRLQAAVRDRAGLPAPRLLDELLQQVRRFAGGETFEDDLCLVSVEVARLGVAA